MSQNAAQVSNPTPPLLFKNDSFYEIKRVERFISDLKSPISALRVISTAKAIPQEVRSLIGSSLDRVIDLARDLFEGQPAMLYALEGPLDCHQIIENIDSLIHEKRTLFAQKNFHLEIHKEGPFLEENKILRVPRFHWKRVLSNLMDNALEALDTEGGKLIIKFQEDSDGIIEVCLQDNGRGIPLHFVEKVGRRGFSYGKRKAFGFGSFWARKEIEAINGQFKFESVMGFGSKVTLKIPRY